MKFVFNQVERWCDAWAGRLAMAVLAVVSLLLAAFALPVHAGDRLPWSAQAVQGGISARLELADASKSDIPVPLGRPMTLRLRLSDADGQSPLRGLRPRLWLSRQTADTAEACTDQIRRVAGGRIAARAERDLNGFQLVTLNADATLSVINPQVNVGSTRLESLITLPGVGADWAYLRGADRLLVTLPAQSQLAVVDMAALRLVKLVDLGAGQPRRLVVTPDERRALVALDDSDRLVAVDLASLSTVGELRIGAGLHQLALDADGQRVVATATQDERVTVADARTLRVLASHPVAGTPLGVAYSALSRRAYVAGANGRVLTVLDPASGRLEASLPFPGGVTALRADPSGRFLLGVSPRSDEVHVLDLGTQRLVGSARTVEQPDQVVFSARHAYVRGVDSLAVTLLDLDALLRGELGTSTVPMFQRTPASASQQLGVADMIVPSPEGDGVIVANGADTVLYYYMEGMQAPQGSFRTYNRAPVALRVIDRSLQETAPGEYTTTLRLDRGGRYSVPLLVGEPRLVHCFELAVDETGATPTGRRVAVAYDGGTAAVQEGQERTLRLRLSDGESGRPLTGLRDVQLMALELPGLSQQRGFAAEAEPGLYTVRQRFPRAGTWRLAVQVASLGLAFDRSATLDLPVAPATQAQPGAASTD